MNYDITLLILNMLDIVEKLEQYAMLFLIVCLEYIPTKRQNADFFTKPLDRSKFETLRQVIGVILCP